MNPTGHHQNKLPQVRGVYITLERQIKYGGTKGCAACFGDAKIHSPECKRFKDMEDNEAAQTAASASEPNVEMREQAAGGSAPSSSSDPAPAAGRPAREDANMEPAESSAQPTSSVVRTMEDEDNTSAKRQKLMDWPILQETDVDVNMDAHTLVVLVLMPKEGKWTQRVIDGDKKCGTLHDTQKVYEGLLK